MNRKMREGRLFVGKVTYSLLLMTGILFLVNVQLFGRTDRVKFPQETLAERTKKIARLGEINISFDSEKTGNTEVPALETAVDDVDQVLGKSLEQTDLAFKKVSDNSYIIFHQKDVDHFLKPGEDVRRILSGIVQDQHDEPIVGATILIKGTSKGTITDPEGHFSLAVTGNVWLNVSFLGYVSQEIRVTKNDFIRVILQEENKALDDVVVVGYGVQKKVNLTGAVASVDAEKLERRPNLSTSATLQGILPGVTVTTQSGSPGGDGGQIHIRGINSFGGSDSSPLVLIDGVAGSLDLIDANLIESVSVLKDAASAAIYGSRAANGVILVTTKRASANKFSVNYKGYVGKSDAIDIPEVTDGLTFMQVFNEANMNDYGYALYSDEAIQEFKEDYAKDPSNYDWQGAILNGSGFTQNHFLSLEANSDKIYVMPSISYSSQDGIIKNTGFKRYVVRNNMDIRPNDKISVKFDISFINSDRLQIANEGTVWNYLGRMPTNIPIKRNGLWSEGWVNNNPVAFIEEGGQKKTNNIELTGNLSLEVKPLKWLTLTGMVAPRYQTKNGHTFVKSVMTYNNDGTEAGAANTYTYLTETAYRYFYGNYQFRLSTVNRWKEHTFKLMLGTSRETYDEKYLMGYRRDYTYEDYDQLAAGADNETKDNNGTEAEWLLVSAFGRFNYDYKDRYLFEANFRYDGSSRFTGQNHWATFPSFSVGWRVSEEDFMKGTRNFIDQLKLRASWGKLGNQNIGSSYYPFAETLAVGSISMDGEIYPLVTLNTMSNPDLKWEETRMTGLGIDLNLFSHLSFTGDWYRKKTDGILMQLYTSQLTGLNAPYQNAAKVRNTGWELSLNYQNQWGDFQFGGGINLADVKNTILDMDGQTSGTLLRQQEGYSVNSIYGYVAEGLYQTQEEIDEGPTQFGTIHPGDIKYKDIAGAFDEHDNPVPDGKITDDDKEVIGSTIPRYTYGFNLDLGWRGIKLNAFFQGVGKVDGYLDSHYVIPCVNSSAIKTWQLDYWREDNRDAAFPRVSITSTNNTQNSTYWMKRASYLRLKDLQVGYELPKKLVQKAAIQNVYIYVNAQNLFTITDFWKGYDPEVAYDASTEDGVSLGSAAYYPQVKVYSFGIDIKF